MADADRAPLGDDTGAPSAHGTDELRRSPLEASHLRAGAKLVEFGGWLMPLSYPTGTLEEHKACRSDAALFDVSHLGTVNVEGPGSFDLLQRELGNDLRKVEPGRAQYTHLLDEGDGSVLDDIIVWWRAPEVFDVMPNASNTARVLGALGGRDTTATRAVLAVQGPRARQKLAKVFPEAASVPHFAVRELKWAGADITVSGTGYTGEDGVECAVPARRAEELFEALLSAGLVPAGLGARDTLRLEAGLPLYGHELGPGTTPLQAGLGWAVGWKKDRFRGREALLRERDRGPAKRLYGLVSEGRRPLREGAPVLAGFEKIGTTTSGNFSPMLGCGIAMAYLDTSAAVTAGPGARVVVEMRGANLDADVVKLPFVPAGRARGRPSAPLAASNGRD